MIEDAAGENAIEVIVVSHNTTAEGEWTSDSGSLIGDTVSGVDDEMAARIEDMVQNLTDDANNN